MKIAVKNLGPIKQAEFTLGDLTIICGKNNTGKTYITDAFYGFLAFWNGAFTFKVTEDIVNRLLSEGHIELDIRNYLGQAQAVLKDACITYTAQLPRVFATSNNQFTGSEFDIELDADDISQESILGRAKKRTAGTAKTQLISIVKEAGSPLLKISLLIEKGKVEVQSDLIGSFIGEALTGIVFENLFPLPFIFVAERTGISIFRNELNSKPDRQFEEVNSLRKPVNSFELISSGLIEYPLPVKVNIDFVKRLEELPKGEGIIARDHPDILQDFKDLVGGDYIVAKSDGPYFVPKGGRIKLTMGESSSSVRSLLHIGLYLRYLASPFDILMVDEPELNLHPENQRRVARLFARLVNIGIKVFITTHSDYIVKELNTLIMLNQGGKSLKELAERENYKDSELLAPEKLRVYIAQEEPVMLEGAKRKTKCLTLVPAKIDPKYGAEVGSFDKTIDDMNRIQEEIVWGGDE